MRVRMQLVKAFRTWLDLVLGSNKDISLRTRELETVDEMDSVRDKQRGGLVDDRPYRRRPPIVCITIYMKGGKNWG